MVEERVLNKGSKGLGERGRVKSLRVEIAKEIEIKIRYIGRCFGIKLLRVFFL